MIILVWLLNFVISWSNAWGCGKTWIESRHAGGWPHFLNWCGAIMSAAGFTWCYLVILGAIGAQIPIKAEDGTVHMLLSGASAEAFAGLGYLVIIFPILGSGLAITVHSWGVFWRERNFTRGAIAGWNTFADVYNTVAALENVPAAARGVSKFFSRDRNSDSKDRAKLIVALLVALAAIGGCLTTRAIIRSTARATAFNRRLQYENA